MKKIIVVVLLAIVLCLSGCTSTQNPPKFFLEPDGYVIVSIKYGDDDIWGRSSAYGYITEKEYKSFQDDVLVGNLEILHPYEEKKSVNINAEDIISVSAGSYIDYR